MTGVPLNPCDLFLLMLDGQIRRAGLAGNTCIALLRMESPPDAAELWDYAANLVHSRPKLDARLEFTPFLRRPRWRYPTGGNIPVYEETKLEDLLNRPMNPRKDPVMEFHLLADGVAVRWHHALMDAKGCEHLLAGHSSDVPEGGEYEPDLARHSWWRRFRMAIGMRRRLQAVHRRSPGGFAAGEGEPNYAVRLDAFDEEETKRILTRASLQTNLHLLAATFQALKGELEGSGPLHIPVPANLRKEEWAPVIANYLTFFHFVVDRDSAADVASLKQDHLGQIRSKADVAMVALLHMGRRLSLWRYRREVKPATSYFSFPGESLVTRFLGRPVKEYRSFPAVPPRPGVGVFFGLSGGRLLLTTVYVRGIVDEAQVGRFVDRLKGSL